MKEFLFFIFLDVWNINNSQLMQKICLGSQDLFYPFSCITLVTYYILEVSLLVLTFALFQESLAFMFEMAHLHEDALREYDELELCYLETGAQCICLLFCYYKTLFLNLFYDTCFEGMCLYVSHHFWIFTVFLWI